MKRYLVQYVDGKDSCLATNVIEEEVTPDLQWDDALKMLADEDIPEGTTRIEIDLEEDSP